MNVEKVVMEGDGERDVKKDGGKVKPKKTIWIYGGRRDEPELNTRGSWRRQWKDARNVLVRTTWTLFKPSDTWKFNPLR